MLKKLLFLFFFLNYILNLNFLYAQKSSTICTELISLK